MSNQTLRAYGAAITAVFFLMAIIGIGLFSARTSELTTTISYVGELVGGGLFAGVTIITVATIIAGKAAFDLYLSLED